MSSIIDERDRFLRMANTQIRSRALGLKAGSPIEVRFFYALLSEGVRRDVCVEVFEPFRKDARFCLERRRICVDDNEVGGSWGRAWSTFLAPYTRMRVAMQVPIGKYRADFLVQLTSRAWGDGSEWAACAPVVVECDGHDFHERSKDQARRDRKHDRFMTAHQIPVLRFTGSELFKDAMACAKETYRYLAQGTPGVHGDPLLAPDDAGDGWDLEREVWEDVGWL